MSRIDDMIERVCPNGVEFKKLGEIGQLVRGNGLPKTAFTATGVGAIHYGQIYTYYGISTTETISFVAPDTAANLVKVNPGDIIITNTSENLEDVGKAVAWLGDKQIVTGGHATVLKNSHRSRSTSPTGFRARAFRCKKGNSPRARRSLTYRLKASPTSRFLFRPSKCSA